MPSQSVLRGIPIPVPMLIVIHHTVTPRSCVNLSLKAFRVVVPNRDSCIHIQKGNEAKTSKLVQITTHATFLLQRQALRQLRPRIPFGGGISWAHLDSSSNFAALQSELPMPLAVALALSSAHFDVDH